MAKLTLETSDREKPLLLLVGEKNPLIKVLIEGYSKDFKIALVSDSSPRLAEAAGGGGPYLIKPDAASLIKNLEEKIDYAVIFLQANARDYINSVFEKLTSDGTKTAVIVDITKVEEFYDIILVAKSNLSFYFLFAGDIYSEDPEFNQESETHELIEKVLRQKSVKLGGDLSPIFPVYIKDAIRGINHVLFGPVKSAKFYYLFYKHPQTYISAIHILERVEPELQIDYEKEYMEKAGSAQEIESKIQAKLTVTPSYLDQYLEGFEKSIHYFVERPQKTFKETGRIKRVSAGIVAGNVPKLKFLYGAIIYAVLIFVSLNIILGAAGIVLFKNSIAAIKNGNYKMSADTISAAGSLLDLVKPATTLVARSAGVLGFSQIEENYYILSEAVSLSSIASKNFEAIGNITQGMERTSLDQKIADSFFLYFQTTKLGFAIEDKIPSAQLENLPVMLSLSTVAPQVLGYNGGKKYLLLFQNNGELRPTGGFVGSVGELIIKNGKMEKIDLRDVYEYDGKLKKHVEPHYIVRRYLQPHLYLRDSNFNPDFQESASSAALLYSFEANRNVDGVIALNFEAVRRIIEEIGPIELTTYNKTLTGENAFEFLENTIDDNFFPGSTQKKDVLRALFNQLIIRLENPDSFIKIARLIPKLANEKHILFAFNKNSIQGVFTNAGYAGVYKEIRTKTNDTINDILGINEANIGVNKANINVQRSTDLEVKFEGKKIISRVTHRLNNAGNKEYKTYIRVLTPALSKMSGIKIDNAEQKLVAAVTDYQTYEKKTFKAPEGLEVDQNTVGNLQSFGFIVVVKPKTDQTIEVEYVNGANIPNESIVNYYLKLIKQPGTSTFPFTLKVDYGNDFSPKEVENAQLQNGVVVLNSEVDTDKEFKAQFIRR